MTTSSVRNFLLLLLWLSPSVSFFAQEKTSEPPDPIQKVASANSIFADKQLEAAVRRQVFAKRNTSEPLGAEDVKHVSTVQPDSVETGAEIKSLEGLQHCLELSLLELPHHQISDLKPLTGLKKLQSITLSHNRIQSLEGLEGCSKLQYLNLEHNQVASLKPLAGLKQINPFSRVKPQQDPWRGDHAS